MRRKEFEDLLISIHFYKNDGKLHYVIYDPDFFGIFIDYLEDYQIRVKINRGFHISNSWLLNLTKKPFENILKLIEEGDKNTKVGNDIKRIIRERKISNLLEP